MLKGMMRRKMAKVVLVLMVPVTMVLFSFRLNSAADENAVKAMFVYNFTKYFDWSAIETHQEFIIAVYGNTGISKYLNEVAARKNVNGKAILVKTIMSIPEAAGAQFLVVAAGSTHAISEVADNPKLKSVIIISEEKSAIKKGAHLNFVNIDGKMRFEMNESLMKNNGIRFSKELASLAIQIY